MELFFKAITTSRLGKPPRMQCKQMIAHCNRWQQTNAIMH